MVFVPALAIASTAAMILVSAQATNLTWQPTPDAPCFLSPDAAPLVLPAHLHRLTSHGWCPKGFFCPHANLTHPPQVCPPTQDCVSKRLNGEFCGPQGLYDVAVCPWGSYCPNASTMHTCPSGHYCPLGADRPKKCHGLTYCPGGNDHQLFLGSILIVALVDFSIVLVFVVARRLQAAEKQKRREAHEQIERAIDSELAQSNALIAMGGGNEKIQMVESEGDDEAEERRRPGTPTAAVAADRERMKRKQEAMSKQQTPKDQPDQSPHSPPLAENIPYPNESNLNLTPANKGAPTPHNRDSEIVKPHPLVAENLERMPLSTAAAEKQKRKERAPEQQPLNAPTAGDESDSQSQTSKSLSRSVSATRGRIAADAIRTICATVKRRAQHFFPMEVSFNDLKLSLPATDSIAPGKIILDNVSGTLRKGRVTAIMGPSGCGKTQLSRCVFGKSDSSWAQSGDITLTALADEGAPADGLARCRPFIGYVPQDDILHADLSVRDNIWYNAALRRPSDVSLDELNALVDAVIDAVGLRKVEDNIVGTPMGQGSSLSGGQRKRCNVAVELVSAPLLLFLDEPTTGLDASTALDLCALLQSLARTADIPVSLVIHQPRVAIWDAIDDVLLLGPGGRVVFDGSRTACMEYFSALGVDFSNGNPADLVIDAVALSGAGLANRWAEMHSESFLEGLLIEDPPRPDEPARDPRRVWEEAAMFDFEKFDLFAESAIKWWAELTSGGGTPPGRQQLELSAGQIAGNNNDDQHQPQSIVANTNATAQVDLPPEAQTEAEQAQALRNKVEELRSWFMDDHLRQVKRRQRRAKQQSKLLVKKTAEAGGHTPQSLSALLVDDRVGFVPQLLLYIGRQLRKQQEAASLLVLDNVLGVVAAATLATAVIHLKWILALQGPYILLSAKGFPGEVSMAMMFLFIAMASVTGPSGVRIFTNDRVSYWREAASGANRVAYYMGNNIADTPRVVVSALHFVTVSYLMMQPIQSFDGLFGVFLLAFFCADGLSAFLSHFLSVSVAPLAATVVGAFMALLNGFPGIPGLKSITYTWWATEVVQDLERAEAYHMWDVAGVDHFGYHFDMTGAAIGIMFAWWFALRISGFIVMLLLNRDKQR